MSDKMFNFIKKGYLHDLIWKYGTKKTVTQNGTDIDVAGLDKIDVNVPNPSTGKVNITSTAEVNVTQYAAAQVVDANLVAENIKKDIPILGVTGSYEGGSGGGDWSNAEVTFESSAETYYVHTTFGVDSDTPIAMQEYLIVTEGSPVTVSIPLYMGAAIIFYNQLDNVDNNVMPTIDGDIELGQAGLIITGNGTISAAGLNQG